MKLRLRDSNPGPPGHQSNALTHSATVPPFGRMIGCQGCTTKVVMMHRCIAILGPAIRVSYRDPTIAILKKIYISHTWILTLFCPFCCPHTAWIVLCIFYCAILGHFWFSAIFLPFTALIMPFIFSSPR